MEKSSKTTQSEPTKIEDMNEGVQIIIERMETHPEEFSHGIHEKWSDIIGDIMQRVKDKADPVPFLDDHEVKAIYDKLRDLERQEFTARVLRRLADTPEEEGDQLNLPYVPAIPRGQVRMVSSGEMELARKLGVSVETYLEAKRMNALKQIYQKSTRR